MVADVSRPYYNNVRSDLDPFLPDKVERLLDVGCASGTFAESMKERKGAEVWGIEYLPQVAEEARPKLDHVFAGDALSHMPSLPSAHFDLITFNDSLEHMIDPWAVLQEAKRLLKPGGKVLASLPNMRYLLVFKELVFNREFKYTDAGVLDRTHLRWFTDKTLRRMFEDTGYNVIQLEGINPYHTPKVKLLNRLTRNRFWDLPYQQFVVVAEPRS